MPRVVSDTTPLISLLKISQLDLLQRLYGEILIPKAVFNEVEAGKGKHFYTDFLKLPWIKVVGIANEEALNQFFDLDAGEAEAIVLATELHADLILVDEKLGRWHAKHAGLKVSGTIGVLIKAKREGLIPGIKQMLDDLIARNVWIGEKLKTEILKQVGE